jgi:cobalt-zinc-cadmium efflux system outer membrane protein
MLFHFPSLGSSQQTGPSLKGYAATGAAAFVLGIASITTYGQTKLSLHEAIQQTQNSPAAPIAKSQVEASHGLLKQAVLRPNPRLYLQSKDLRPWAIDFAFPNNTENYAHLGQTIEMDGKRSKRLQLANANLRRTDAERSLQIQQLAGRVAASYWNAVSAARIS